MSYLSHDGLAYFKHKLANWVDANYLSKTSTGPLTVNGDVTFTKPIHGNLDGNAKNDWRGQKIDDTYVANIVGSDGTLKLINGAGSVIGTVYDTTVTQNKSTANNLYPVLLCYDASAEASQLHKTVWFGSDVQVNPYYGYLALNGLYVKDRTGYNRRDGSPSVKKEWSVDFMDDVEGLGNPMAQVHEYLDIPANGGEHCIELRLYGNPNSSPNIPTANDTTNTAHIGVGITKGGAAPNGAPVKFGYCPSTPIYEDNGTSFRTVGTDIITRDWLALNGSITGLVHTTMDETIDGNKTFKKTVVINSGNNNSPAGLQVQGDTNIGGSGTIGQNLTVGGKTTTQTLEVKDDATVDGDLLVKGNETVNGSEHVKQNLTVDGNETVGGTLTTTGKLTANGTAEIKGGSGNNPSLKVVGNETVSGTLAVDGKITGNGGIDTTTLHATDDVIADDDMTVGDTLTVGTQILKKTGNTTQEYVDYVTQQNTTKTTIINNLIDPDQGLKLVTKNGQSYIAVKLGDGLLFNTAAGTKGQIDVNFKDPDPAFIQGIVENMIDWSGGLASKPEGYLLAGEYYTDNKGVRRRVTAAQATEQFTGADGETYYGMKDPNSGKLIVDFSKIDEDTKADILATLDLQYPLTANLYVTVDPNGVSEAEETYGIASTDALTHKVGGKWINYTFKERKSIPFKTIQGAVNWVSSRVNLANRNAYIDVVAGVYEESVSLPQLARSTGVAVVRTKSGLKDVTVRPPKTNHGYYGTAFSAGSGTCVWHVYHMTCDKRLGEIPTATGIATSGMAAGVSGAVLHLHGCDYIVRPEHLDETNPNSAERTEFVGQPYTVRLIDADGGGTVHLHPDALGSNINVRLPTTNTEGIGIDVINVARGSYMYFRRSNPPADMYDENDTEAQRAAKDEVFASYYVQGTFSRFISCWQSGITNSLGGSGIYMKFPVAANATATGIPYRITGGSHIISPERVYLDNDPESQTYHQYYYVFPGDGTPYVETNTFCWINTPNNYPQN